MGIYIKNFTKEDLIEMLYTVPLRYKVPEEGDIIEVAEPHGDLVDANTIKYNVGFIQPFGEQKPSCKVSITAPIVIESEE